jgi:small multidrug resistance pump
MTWLYLAFAILLEVVATSALKAADGFTRPLPSLVVLVCYGGAFYLLSLALRGVPLGIAYAIWSGVGLALVSVVGWLLYGQALDAYALGGIALVTLGVFVLSFSRTAV